MKRERAGQFARLLTSSVATVAWFALSNHCALAAVAAEPTAATEECPMHPTSEKPAPAKEKDCDGAMPCCKTLRALVGKSAQASAGYRSGICQFHLDQIELAILAAPLISSNTVVLGIGPPEARTFAELTLQRSILAHAPPHHA